MLKGLEDLSEALPGVPLLLLKGGALLLTGCADIRRRSMQDLDVWVRPEQASETLQALRALGYKKSKNSSGQFVNGGVAVDLHTDLWYLEESEQRRLWEKSRPVLVERQRVWVPAPEDHLVFLLAHAAVQHGAFERKWGEDVGRLWDTFFQEIDPSRVHTTLQRLGLWPAARWFLNRCLQEVPATGHVPGFKALAEQPPHGSWERAAAWGLQRLDDPYKGHLLRFIFLRSASFRLRYAARAFFPDALFLRLRYDQDASRRIPLWRFLRPYFLFWKLVLVCVNLIAMAAEQALQRIRRLSWWRRT